MQTPGGQGPPAAIILSSLRPTSELTQEPGTSRSLGCLNHLGHLFKHSRTFQKEVQ